MSEIFEEKPESLVILVVEDTEALRSALFLGFAKTCPFKAHCVESVGQALDFLRTNKDRRRILVTDFELGQGTGEDLLQHILKEELPLTGVIVMSGRVDLDHLMSAVKDTLIKINVPMFTLVKPFQFLDLLNLIERLLWTVIVPSKEELVHRVARFNGISKRKSDFVCANEPGCILQSARATLGISEKEIVEQFRKAGGKISLAEYRKYERDRTGLNMPAFSWFLLCQLLNIDCDCVSYGYGRLSHLSRIRRAISEKSFSFVVSEHLLKGIAELEEIEEEERKQYFA